METSDLLKQLTSQDKTTLEGSDEYAGYFRYLQDTFDRLIESYRSRAIRNDRPRKDGSPPDDPREIAIIRDFVGQFLSTIEAFRMKYLCEPDVRLRFDPTDSSFPNHIEFRELEADLQRRDKMLRELPKVEVLKQAILDTLFKHRSVPKDLLRQLGQREYFLLLQRHATLGGGLFREFTPGQLELIDEGGVTEPRRYLFSWGAFDVLTNRPHVYLLIFDQKQGGMRLDQDAEAYARFETSIRQHTNNTAPLRVIAHDIDAEYPHLFPKVLKRTDLGPLYGHYSKDDHLYTKLLRDHFAPEDRVFRFTTEIIFSIGEKRTKSFLSKGELRQIFFVDQSNAETMERHVSEVHKYMLATHPIVQYLNDHHADRVQALAMPPITFTPRKAGIHGTE